MKNFRGWSLLEVLIVITIAAVAGGLLINILVSSNKLFFDQSAQISHGLSLNQTTYEITDLIKFSVSASSQYPPSGNPQYLTDSNTLVIKLPAISQAGDIIDSVFDYAVIEADSSNSKILRKKIIPDAQSYRHAENKVLSTALDSIEFSYLDINNSPVSPGQAARIKFVVNLATGSGFSENESSASGIVNIKNL